MKLVLLPEAKRDLQAAQAWYDEQKPGLGLALRDELDALLGLIRRRPKLFAEVKPRIRCCGRPGRHVYGK
jgi:hypothetical protein